MVIYQKKDTAYKSIYTQLFFARAWYFEKVVEYISVSLPIIKKKFIETHAHNQLKRFAEAKKRSRRAARPRRRQKQGLK